MIDEKKIEEAAEKASIDYYSECRYEDLDFQQGFMAGINWFLDNLWHDASEEPEATPKENDGFVYRSKIVWLLALTDDGIGMMYSTHENDHKGESWLFHDQRGFEYDPFDGEIKKWLYIDDLLKGGK